MSLFDEDDRNLDCEDDNDEKDGDDYEEEDDDVEEDDENDEEKITYCHQYFFLNLLEDCWNIELLASKVDALHCDDHEDHDNMIPI